MEINQKILIIALYTAQGLITGSLVGLAWGHVFKIGAVHTAKILAILSTASSILITVPTLASPAKYKAKVYWISSSASSISLTAALRHYGLIATKGTYFFIALNICFIAYTMALFLSNERNRNVNDDLLAKGF